MTEVVDRTNLPHLVSFAPRDVSPRDRGPVAIRNPDCTDFADTDGKPLPWHGGLIKRPDGVTTTCYVILGVCEAHDGSVFRLALRPSTTHQIGPEQLR